MSMNIGKPGAIVLIGNGEHYGLNWMIRRAQRRLLGELGASDVQIKTASEFTHAVLKLSDEKFGEMYSPHARTRKWSELEIGTKLCVREFKNLTPEQRMMLIAACSNDIFMETPYPYKELIYYLVDAYFNHPWWAGVFGDSHSDVCSGRIVWWAQAAGLMKKEKPEEWFPARLCVDEKWLSTVGTIVL